MSHIFFVLLWSPLIQAASSSFGIGLDKNPVKNDGEGFQKKQKGARDFLAKSASLRKYTRDHYTRDVSNCPPSDIKLTTGKTIEFGNGRAPGIERSGSRFYFVDKFVIKFISSSEQSVIESLADERAFLKLFGGERGIPKVYELKEGTVQPECAIRLLISDKVGDEELAELELIEPQWEKQVYLFEAAAQALEILKSVHSLGLIHGDIEYQNLVYDIVGSGTEGEIKVGLIDFGSAEPFVNPADGAHVPEEKKEYKSDRLRLLSPWELEGKRKTRRDDLFRLAEALLESGFYDTIFYEQEGSLESKYDQALKGRSLKFWQNGDAHLKDYKRKTRELKMDRPFTDDVPQILIDFYQATLNLDFGDTINYDEWIDRFREESKEVSDSQEVKARIVAKKSVLESITSGISKFGKQVTSFLSGIFG